MSASTGRSSDDPRAASELGGGTTPVRTDSLEKLYEAFYLALVRRATWRFGLSKDDAAEIVHDAFLLAVTKADFGRNPKAWIFTVVDRLAANSRRKTDRRARLFARWGGNRFSASSFESNADWEDGAT